eukprot:g45883.t1
MSLVPKDKFTTVAIVAGLSLAGLVALRWHQRRKEGKKGTRVRVALDWTPNTNHLGFFVAKNGGLYEAEGLDVEFVCPKDLPKGSPGRAVAQGFATFAVAPSESPISFATAPAGTPKLIAIASLLQKSTVAICTLKSSGINRPRDLDGKRYASYGARFEDLEVAEMVRYDGGKGDVKFHSLKDFAYKDDDTMYTGSVVASFLQKGKSDSTWIFTHWEGLMAERAGQPLNMFSPDDYGRPFAGGMVIMADPKLLNEKTDL